MGSTEAARGAGHGVDTLSPALVSFLTSYPLCAMFALPAVSLIALISTYSADAERKSHLEG